MVEDAETFAMDPVESVLFSEVAPGSAIMDSGATKTVVGEGTWQKWMQLLAANGKEVSAKKAARDFRFGDGATIRSHVEVSFDVESAGLTKTITASVIPRNTPLLLARPVMEDWKVIQDYSTGKIQMFGKEHWISPKRTTNGHYLLELIPKNQAQVFLVEKSDEPYVDVPMIMTSGEHPDDLNLVADEDSMIEATLSSNEVEAAILTAEQIVDHEQEGRRKIFWELYVDIGSLSQEMSKKPGTEAAVFGLREWDLDNSENQATFKRLMCDVMPSHIWMSPPCTLWSTTQNLNCRTEAQKRELLRKCQTVARRQLNFVYEVFLVAVEMGSHATIEHPAGSAMWKTRPICDIPYYHDVMVDRCRTGLQAKGDDGPFGPVRKRTLLRTTSTPLARALSLPCLCNEPHVQMWGRSQALKQMQNNEPGFVNLAVKAIQRDMEETWARRQASLIFTTEDLPQPVKDSQHDAEQMNKALVRRVGRNAVLTVA